MKCPKCGYIPPRGAPQKFNRKLARFMRKQGQSYRSVAAKLGVSEGAIRAALKKGKASC